MGPEYPVLILINLNECGVIKECVNECGSIRECVVWVYYDSEPFSMLNTCC